MLIFITPSSPPAVLGVDDDLPTAVPNLGSSFDLAILDAGLGLGKTLCGSSCLRSSVGQGACTLLRFPDRLGGTQILLISRSPDKATTPENCDTQFVVRCTVE